MPTSAVGHRVIGIRHTLKKLKAAGLVEEDSLYPPQAVSDIQAEVLRVATRWYRVGARRGALEVLDAFLDGRLTIRTSKDGSRTINAKVDKIVWKRRLNVTVGAEKRAVKAGTYRLTMEELEFE